MLMGSGSPAQGLPSQPCLAHRNHRQAIPNDGLLCLLGKRFGPDRNVCIVSEAGRGRPSPTRCSVVAGYSGDGTTNEHSYRLTKTQRSLTRRARAQPGGDLVSSPPCRDPPRHRLGHGQHPAPLTPPPQLNPRLLLSAIIFSDDLDSLLELLQCHESRLNLRHLDAALNRLGRLTAAASRRDGGFATSRSYTNTNTTSSGGISREAAAAAASRAAGARLLSFVLPAQAAALTPRDCASLLSVLTRLELVPPPALAALLQGRLLEQLRDSSVRDRAQLLHACARLRLPLPAAAVSELLRSLDGELVAAGKPQDVSMVLWSLATLGVVPHPSWLHRLTAALPAPRLAAFQAQALANSAWALARLGFQPQPTWLAALVDASGPLLRVCYMQELVNLLWSLAVLRHRPPAAWLVEALGLLRDRAATMTAQDVSNVCWSLAVLRVRPGLPLLQRLVARALAVRRQMTPQGLVTTLWGLARLGVQLPERAVALLLRGGMGAAALAGAPAAPAAPGSAAAAASAGFGGSISGGGGGGGRAAGPGDLAGAALVLARCRHVPQRRWLVRYCAAVARELHGFGPRELSTLLYGIGRLSAMGLRPDPHWLDLLLAAVERHTPAAAAATAAADAGGSIAGGEPAPKPAPVPLDAPAMVSEALPSEPPLPPVVVAPAVGSRRRPQAQQQQQPELLESPQLAVVLWAVARLGHQPPEAWLRAMSRAVAARAEEFGPAEAAATIRALQELAAAAAAGPRAPAPSRPRARLDRAAAAAATAGGCREAVASLASRLAGSLPERSMYGTLRAVSMARGGMSYATVADQLLTEVYSVRSLGLLQEGPQPLRWGGE